MVGSKFWHDGCYLHASLPTSEGGESIYLALDRLNKNVSLAGRYGNDAYGYARHVSWMIR